MVLGMKQEKISDPGLLAFLEGDTGVPRTVLVAVATEPPKVKLAPRKHGMGGPVPKGVTTDPETESANRQVVERAAAALEEALGHPVKWLPAGQVFVVSASADELRRVAALDEVVSVVAGDGRIGLLS